MAKDPYKYFRVEARELIEQLGSGLAGTERDGAARPEVPRLLRLAHTLKGAARVVRQPEIAELAHEVEDHLAPFREGQAAVPRSRIEAVVAILDAIAARVAALAPPPDPALAAVEEPFRTLRTDVAEMDELLDGIAETQVWLGALRRSVADLGRARQLAGVVGEQIAAARGRASQRSAGGGVAEKPLRDLESLVSRLERGMSADVERVERELQQVRSAAERLRLLPISALFSSLERAVSDAARTLGKRAAFRGEGGDIRLDGHVLAALQAALVQLVRNAVAHGIEPEAERVSAGKPAEGSVVVAVGRRGSRVVIACRDDGRGVDFAAVRRALERKQGGPPPVTAAPEELLRTLLDGGITTSSAVTDVSGRGVGLDVVREVTRRLGAQAELRSEPGKGATLELVVPVSLSSLDALVVEAGGVTSAIPVEAVRHAVPADPNALAGGPGGASIVHEGELIPFLPLAHALDAQADGRARVASVVVVRGRGGLAALGVERLLGRASLLVRPLPALASIDAVVSGLSLDAEGNPRPVLDAERLIESARAERRPAAPPPAPVPPILVVDDSLTTRMLEQSILESAGYTVEVAASGEEALAKARRQRYSLFLVDVEMPGMDGFVLLEHLRSDPDLRGIPALLITSRQAPEDRARGMQAGACAYIVKNEFDQTVLLGTIRGLVG